MSLNIENYSNIIVIQDGIVFGGSKARIIPSWLDKVLDGRTTVSYGGPKTGYAQLALAVACKQKNLKCELSLSGYALEEGEKDTNVTKMAKKCGAKIFMKSRANWVAQLASNQLADNKTLSCDFGFDNELFINTGIEIISQLVLDTPKIAHLANQHFHLFVACGTGTFARILMKVFPNATIHGVQIGREVNLPIIIHRAPEPFYTNARIIPPYESVINYDAKVWQFALIYKKENLNDVVLIWNIAK